MEATKDEHVDGDPCERSIVDALEMPESEEIEFEPGRLGVRTAGELALDLGEAID